MSRAATRLAAAVVLATVSGCETVDQGDPPADINACRPSQTYFVEIWEQILDRDYGGMKCHNAQCHGAASTNSLRLTSAVPPAKDAGGTLVIAIPFVDAGWSANYRSTTEQMNCSNVAASKLLALPTLQRPHRGGMLFPADGPEATLIKGWIGAAGP